MLTIRGERLELREFTEGELAAPEYFAWLRDYEVARNLYRQDYLKSLPFEKVAEYVRSIIASDRDSMLAIYVSQTQRFIGTLKIGHIDWRSGVGDLGVMIGSAEHRGKGLAKEAVLLGCKYAFRWLGLRKLTGGTLADNLAMIKCFEHAGFALEGVRRQELLVGGEYLDHRLYGLLRAEYVARWPQ